MADEKTNGGNGSGDAPEQVDLNMGNAVERIDSWVDGAVTILPNLVVAVIIFALFFGAAILAQNLVTGRFQKKDRDNLGEILGGFLKWVVLIFGFLIAMTIVIPTLNPGDLIAGLGVSSVAIGFAFKDILQNWLAGLLILIRQPFQIGDQIEVDGFEGTVQRIETRATIIKTYDSQRIVIPNSDIYTNSVVVKTAHEKRRSQYDIGIGYSDDIDLACEIILKAINDIDGVETDPGAEALAWELAASWVTIRARWWTKPERANVVKVHAAVIRAVKKALDEANIDMPYETYIQLLHDQTEETDGNRDAQREGWPSAKNGSTTPRWKAEMNAKNDS